MIKYKVQSGFAKLKWYPPITWALFIKRMSGIPEKSLSFFCFIQKKTLKESYTHW